MKDNMKRAPFSTQIDLSKFDMKDFAKASDEEKRQQEVMGESTTFLKDGLKRLRKNPLAMGSIIVLVLLILVILLAPKIVPYGYADIVKGAQNLGPFQYSFSPASICACSASLYWKGPKFCAPLRLCRYR